MINVIPGSQLISDQQALDKKNAQLVDEANGEMKEELETKLVAYVRKKWQDALMCKRDVEIQMLKNKRQRNGEYEGMKLAAIRAMGSAESFVLLSDTKCRSGLAWIKDVLFQPGTKPWSLEPTPEPQLPPELEMEVLQKFVQNLMQNAQEQAMTTGQPFQPSEVYTDIQQNMYGIKANLRNEFYKAAKDRAVTTEKHIDDQLEEGGWYEALEDALYDLVELKAGIIKGPVLRKEKTRKKSFNTTNRSASFQVEEKIVPKFERRSPFDIYPGPGSCGVNDTYLIDKIKLTRKALYDLIGAPGFNEKEIREVLKEFDSGSLREWTGIESERSSAEGKDSVSIFKVEVVDCLELWDYVPGNLLVEWGLTEGVDDPDDSYAACIWMIGAHVIKAMLNYDMFGNKPFHVASFESSNDSFWGKGIPELISDVQGICNAVVRAMVNNVGLASGPQIEVNRNRFPAGYPFGIWPWKVWESTDAGLSSAPAIKVNHIPLNADKLIMLYNHFSKLADEESGVPAYSHGDPQVGGGGNTASGLSMLMTQAARGIKSVIRMIDTRMISPSIESLYYLDMEMEDSDEYIFDLRIVARGSSSLIAKEQQAMRLTDFLNATNNPVDVQIMGLEGRKNLLEQAAKANEIDTEKILPESIPTGQQMPMMPGAPSQVGNPASVMAPGGVPNQQAISGPDVAGNTPTGQDTRLIPQ